MDDERSTLWGIHPPAEPTGASPGRFAVACYARRMGSADSSRRDRSHARIVEVAARLVRERGLEGAGVDRVMGAAGLTRGGFYAHFADKAAMIVEALDAAFAQSRRNMFDHEATGLAWLERTTALYLSRSHAESVDRGCSVPALASEVPRSTEEVRAAFSRNVERVLDELATRLGDGRATAATRREAMGIFSTWVGGLALARTLGGALGDEVLLGARDLVLTSARAKRADQPARKGPSAKAQRAKSSDAVSPRTRTSASSGKPAARSARSSRSHA